MVTDAQVGLLEKEDGRGIDRGGRSGGSRMSECSAYVWTGPLPSETRDTRSWRARPDPFVDVWEGEVVPLLRADTEAALEATTVLGELQHLLGAYTGLLVERRHGARTIVSKSATVLSDPPQVR